MEDSLRTFIAVHVHPGKELVQAIEAFEQELEGEKIRFVDKNSMHLTLKFLGETSGELAKEVTDALENALNDFKKFRFLLKGIGYFKNRKQPVVLFARAEQENRLSELFQIIEEQLSYLGIPREQRKFHPHLTLARIKYISDRKLFYELAEQFRDAEFQYEDVKEVVFYSSVLTPKGPEYKPIKVFRLRE